MAKRTTATESSHGPASDKRAAILDAALELFVERGFHGTAVPAVAERAKVGAGTIYRYFESKEALVNVLYREWKERLASHLLADFSPTGSAREQFGRVWRRMADFVQRHPTAYAFLELHHHASYLDEESVKMEQQLFGLAITFIRSAQTRGEFRDMLPSVLWSLVEGAFIGLVRSSKEDRVELGPSTLEAAESAVWEMIRA
jgi:TetR/AcrR family transcriptional regulator, repressor of fatR-cypB operon